MAARYAVPVAHWLAPRLARAGSAEASKPLPIAAIRIPERVSERLSVVLSKAPMPALYVHEGARQALERRLQAAHSGHVVLSITDNRHSIISQSRLGGVLRVRLHHMFLDAPAKVQEALVRYIIKGDREASLRVGLYIEENGFRLARRRPRNVPLHPKGKHHDLLAIFQEVNERYFDGAANALVTWGRRVARAQDKKGARTPRRTIKLGSYAAHERIIRIHPALDRAWVPRYFVAFVMYHEMLHAVMPHTVEGGRRALHPPAFVERERAFRNYQRAIEWEKRHIARLLRVS
mgnify:CR=1 FL=1